MLIYQDTSDQCNGLFQCHIHELASPSPQGKHHFQEDKVHILSFMSLTCGNESLLASAAYGVGVSPRPCSMINKFSFTPSLEGTYTMPCLMPNGIRLMSSFCLLCLAAVATTSSGCCILVVGTAVLGCGTLCAASCFRRLLTCSFANAVQRGCWYQSCMHKQLASCAWPRPASQV